MKYVIHYNGKKRGTAEGKTIKAAMLNMLNKLEQNRIKWEKDEIRAFVWLSSPDCYLKSVTDELDKFWEWLEETDNDSGDDRGNSMFRAD